MINNGKSKAPLALIELLVMILVFALSATICLRAFAHAENLSRKQEAKVHGTLAAQNTAELLKSTQGDYESVVETLGGYQDGSGRYLIGDKDRHQQTACYLLITPLTDTDPYLASAMIQVFYDDETLLEITVAWQEVQYESR